MWSRAYLHSGVLNGVTTGLGGVKRRFAGAQRSSSHILRARNHMIDVFVRSPTSSFQRVSFPSLTMLSERGSTSVRSIKLTRRSKHIYFYCEFSIKMNFMITWIHQSNKVYSTFILSLQEVWKVWWPYHQSPTSKACFSFLKSIKTKAPYKTWKLSILIAFCTVLLVEI